MIDRKYLTNVPTISLVASNCLPVVGVLFWGWDVFFGSAFVLGGEFCDRFL